MSTAAELLDVLAEDGGVVERKPRHLVHRDHDLHGLVFVWSAFVVGERPVMVLQRRGRPGDPYAGQIDALAGGHILAGETAVDAGRRELLEEVGLAASPPDLLYLGSSRKERPSGDCRSILQYLLLYPVPLDLSRLRFSDEVDGLAQVDLEEFSELVLGRRESLRGRVRFAGEQEQIVEQEMPRSAVTGYPDEILDTFRRSLASIRVWARTGRIDPGCFAE